MVVLGFCRGVFLGGNLSVHPNQLFCRYCVLGITDEFIYEGADFGGSMLGRAFGGSRIAVFSTATYARSLAAHGSGSAVGTAGAVGAFAQQMAVVAHETMHCFGLDHCCLYSCCMNSWCDEISEFAPAPRKGGKQRKFDGGVRGTIHLCPVCVRKLRVVCGTFPARSRITPPQHESQHTAPEHRHSTQSQYTVTAHNPT